MKCSRCKERPGKPVLCDVCGPQLVVRHLATKHGPAAQVGIEDWMAGRDLRAGSLAVTKP